MIHLSFFQSDLILKGYHFKSHGKWECSSLWWRGEHTSLLVAAALSFELGAVTSANSQPVVVCPRFDPEEEGVVVGLSTIKK